MKSDLISIYENQLREVVGFITDEESSLKVYQGVIDELVEHISILEAVARLCDEDGSVPEDLALANRLVEDVQLKIDDRKDDMKEDRVKLRQHKALYRVLNKIIAKLYKGGTR